MFVLWKVSKLNFLRRILIFCVCVCSRAKSKQKRVQTDKQLRELQDKNKDLELQVQTLQKELRFIREWAGGHPSTTTVKEEAPENGHWLPSPLHTKWRWAKKRKPRRCSRLEKKYCLSPQSPLSIARVHPHSSPPVHFFFFFRVIILRGSERRRYIVITTFSADRQGTSSEDNYKIGLNFLCLYLSTSLSLCVFFVIFFSFQNPDRAPEFCSLHPQHTTRSCIASSSGLFLISSRFFLLPRPVLTSSGADIYRQSPRSLSSPPPRRVIAMTYGVRSAGVARLLDFGVGVLRAYCVCGILRCSGPLGCLPPSSPAFVFLSRELSSSFCTAMHKSNTPKKFNAGRTHPTGGLQKTFLSCDHHRWRVFFLPLQRGVDETRERSSPSTWSGRDERKILAENFTHLLPPPPPSWLPRDHTTPPRDFGLNIVIIWCPDSAEIGRRTSPNYGETRERENFDL